MRRVPPLARLLLILALALSASRAHAQAEPETGAAVPEPPLRISADHMSGTRGPEGDIVLLEGNVRIVRGTTVITAETGQYLRMTQMLYLRDQVKILDGTTLITCDEASYSEADDVVQLSGDVVATDADATVHAPAAVYNRGVGQLDLYGGVHGTFKQQTLDSDRATYFRDSSVVHARGNVRGMDPEHDVVLTAGEVDYDRTAHEAEARIEPALTSREEGVTTVIRARLLRLNTETRVAEAFDTVRVTRDTLQARGDYGLFDDQAHRGWLLGNPRAWDNQTTVTGDTLELRTVGRELERVVVRGKAVVEFRGSERDSSRLTGERVDVFFTDQDVDSLIATGRARNEYVAAAREGKTNEINLSLGDSITVYFLDRKIKSAIVTSGAKGEYHLAVTAGDTTAAANEVVRYDARSIHYVLDENEIVLDGSAHLTYGEMELNARRVTFDSRKQTLVAEGQPELVESGDKVEGHLMTYDMETRVGNIYKAETAYEKGLYHGERIRRVSEKELQVLNGQYSTCDLEHPHYHFGARWMKIYLKDKLVAKPVVFYVRNVPLFALPFWIFPIKPGRHSGFMLPQFELGFNNRAGRFVRNAGYYWAPNDYFDLTFSGDYYQFEPSWVLRSEGYYKKLYMLDGNFRTSYARNEGQGTVDWDLDAEHQQELSARTRLSARASFVSSKDYNSSNLYGRTIYNRLNRFLTSNLALSHAADWASLSGVIDRRQDLDADNAIQDPDGQGPEQGPPPGTRASLANLTETSPSLSLSFPTRTIGNMPFLKGTRLEKPLGSLYFSLSSRFVSFRERRAFVSGYEYFTAGSTIDSTTVLGQSITSRRGAQANTSLSDSRRLFGWLNVRPSLGADVAVFDFDELGHRNVPTGTWSTSLSSNTQFYGTFRPKIGPLTGVRHIIVPNVSFSYSPEFPHLSYIDSAGIKRSRFNNFGGIGVSGFERMFMNFGIDQRLQVRLGEGEKVRKLDNLMSLAVSGSYNFLWREQNARHPLSALGANLVVSPPGIVNASANAIIDPYEGRPMRSLGYNFGFDLSRRPKTRSGTPDLPIEEKDSYSEDFLSTFDEGWSLGLTYSYSGGYSGPSWSSSQSANLVFRTQVTPAWNFDYSTSYDVTNRQFGIQHFSIVRDLHCWNATFTRTFSPGGEAEYYFRLGVKDQKELYLERGTRTGSLGGIQ